MIGSERPTDADPALMLAFLRGKAGDRKLRLFACACCRLVGDLLPAPAGRARVESAERRADGGTSVPPRRAPDSPVPRPGAPAGLYAEVASVFAGCDDAFAAALVASAMVERADPERGGRAAQAAVLADLFGRPSLRFSPRWRTPEVAGLADAIYQLRRFQDLPRVARLLEGAGCPDASLLDHLRSGAPHARGCWALDLVLGKS